MERKVEICLRSRHRNNVFCVFFFLSSSFFSPPLPSHQHVCRMSCFRGNRVWKFVKIDVDDGDEEWNEQRQIYREYLKVEFLRKYYGFEIFQITFSGRHLSPPPAPPPPCVFRFLFFFFIFFFFIFIIYHSMHMKFPSFEI